jgi:Mrp family chromosome partitioning ATPase
MPGEGKLTSVANLAILIADSGACVTLIDADLRNSENAGYLGLEGTFGLSNALVKRVTLGGAL